MALVYLCGKKPSLRFKPLYMIINYLLVTFRNLLKNRVFTLINILGLGIALSVSGTWKAGNRNMVLYQPLLVLK
jgi:hypothetical protein